MLHDFRTKDKTQWTYYVVDNVPRMSNIYRFDTVQEAIDKYQSLPNDVIKAIGSSKDNRYEIDHIHCRAGQNVLVMDSANRSPWKDSYKLQESIDTMIAYLNVQYQMSSLFGKQYPSAIVELERYKSPELDNYFQNKLLRPADPKHFITAVNEVFVEGEGWMNTEAFLKKLDDSRPKAIGEGAKANFVTRLNIMYIDNTGHCSQVDISTKDFVLLKEKTERECAPDKLAADLYAFASDVDPYEAMDQEDIKEIDLQKMQQDIASGHLAPYTKYLSDYLHDEGHYLSRSYDNAKALLARLTVLTPKEFRKRALLAMIQGAEQKAKAQTVNERNPRSSDKTR